MFRAATAVLAATFTIAATLTTAVTGAAQASSASSAPAAGASEPTGASPVRSACPAPRPGRAQCLSLVRGTQESGAMLPFAADYDHPGTTIVASSGDSGYGPAEFPAVFGSVLAVGGTSLQTARNSRGWTEQAWSGSGSGCSAYVAKPAQQQDRACSMRTVADVSAVADPDTGVAVYDSTFPGSPGWLVVGGTSVASPLIAGVVGLAGNGGITPAYPYQHAKALNDVTAGSNGFCENNYVCTARPGYDGPTGLGTPHGTGAF